MVKKILKVSAIVAAVLVAILVIYIIHWKLTLVTPAEANITCQKFYTKVDKDISSVPGYRVLKGDKTCHPDQDEAGATDYYFSVYFDVAKAGNETIDGLKANITGLAAQYPNQDYDAWIDNNTAQDNTANTICVRAEMQIQEDGSVYQSAKPSHHPSYTEPGKFNTTFQSSCVTS